MDDDVLALGAQLAYGFILSFFPFLIFLLTIVGYSSLKSVDILASLQLLIPENAYSLIKSTVIEVVDYRKGNLLSFAIIGTIWASSSGFRAVIKGLNRAYDTKEKRPYLKVFVISVLSVFALIFIIMSAFLLIVFGDLIGNYIYKSLNLTQTFFYFWNSLRYFIIIAFMIFAFAAMYHFIPCKRMGWREVMPGSIFTTVGWVIASMIFSYYVNNFSNYSKVYGSIGAVIVIILWLYLTSVIIIIGGEINAVLTSKKQKGCK